MACASDPNHLPASMGYEHRLTQRELSSIKALDDEWTQSFARVETPDFADACSLSAQQLTRRLRELAHRFKCLHMSCALQLRGVPVDDAGIGPSPQPWEAPWRNPPTLRAEVTPCLLTTALGDICGWRTQKNGRFLRRIVPTEKYRKEQLCGRSTFLVLICDGGEKYLDTVFHDEWMEERDLRDATVVNELDQLVEQLTVPA